MGCTGRYAEAWQYASFWCTHALVSGVDMGGVVLPAPPNAFLTDPNQDFLRLGGRANVGMVLYNLTRNLSGLITAITETTITATGVTWYNGETYRVVFMNAAQRASIEHYLDITSGDIQAALGAAGACDCSLSPWGANFLAELNIVLARVFYECPCAPSLSADEKTRYAEMAKDRLLQIRNGEIDVCEGGTGALFPSIGWAEQSHTEWNAARIIVNDTSGSVTS